jgi:alkaline phosphatase
MPFYRAYKAGFGSIEADVFPVNGDLLVAHHKEEIQPQQNLKALYLLPLLKETSIDTTRRVTLLVDIKENYSITLPLLIQQLDPLKQYLASPHAKNRLTILISGTRPPPAEYINYPNYIFFDDDLKLKHTVEEWKRVGLVSLPFDKISKWKGDGDINQEDRRRVKNIIDSVHAAGKPIRFWAAPDTKSSWKLQMKLHADFIGTDLIDELANYLSSKPIIL